MSTFTHFLRLLGLVSVMAVLAACQSTNEARRADRDLLSARTTDPGVLQERWGNMLRLLDGRWLVFHEDGKLVTPVDAQWGIPGSLLELKIPFFQTKDTSLAYMPYRQKKLSLIWDGIEACCIETLPDGTFLVERNSEARERFMFDPNDGSFTLHGAYRPSYRVIKVSEELYRKALADLAASPPPGRGVGTTRDYDFWRRIAQGEAPALVKPAAATAPVPGVAVTAPATAKAAKPLSKQQAQLAALADKYNAKAQSEPEQAMQWLACASAATSRATMPAAESTARMKKLVKALAGDKRKLPRNPCPDAFPANVWR